jgi:hypothetical protein
LRATWVKAGILAPQGTQGPEDRRSGAAALLFITRLEKASVTHEAAVTPRVQDNTLRIQDNTLRVQDNTPRVQDNAPCIQDNALRVQDNTPRVQDNALRVQDNTLRIQDNTPRVQDNAPRVQDNMPRIPKRAADGLPPNPAAALVLRQAQGNHARLPWPRARKKDAKRRFRARLPKPKWVYNTGEFSPFDKHRANGGEDAAHVWRFAPRGLRASIPALLSSVYGI